MNEGWLRQTSDGVEVSVLVVPRASRTAIVGVFDERLKIQLNAPPVDGEANQALVALLAERLEVRVRDVTVLAGETGRRKRLAIRGLDAVRAQALLLEK